MRIQKSSVLKPTNKTISMVNNCLFAAEGPNCAGKLDLGSLNMHYDSFFSSKMTLQPNDKDMPIMYGFLGTEVTFLTIVPDYNINPQVCPPDAYIEFFYEDQPLITRTFTDILMLSGNDLHRIPQIYVHNPTDAVVELNIMVANLDINQISAILNPTFEEVGGLSFNSIITDQIYGINCTGSTQFEILDPLATGNTQMIISYASIDIMKIDGDTITIITKVDEPIKLRFLSEFNALQAFSRMNWVYEVQDTRSASPGSPGLDTTGPDIFTILTSPITNLPLDNVTFPYTKTDIINRLILSVFDYDDAHEIRDGEIDIHNGDVIIYDKLRDETVEEITRDSQYKITIIYQDLAGNRSSHVQDISIDTIGPEIIFTTNVNVSTKIIDDMCIYGTTQTPGRICYNDMLRHMINSIWDAVDGTIDRNDKSKFLIEVQDSGGTNIPFNSVVGVPCTGITLLGDYNVTFRAVDSSGNWTIESNYSLKVVDKRPLIIYTLNVDSGGNHLQEDFTMTSGDTLSPHIVYSYKDIIDYAIDHVTTSYGTPLNKNNIEVFIPHHSGLTSGGDIINTALTNASGYNVFNVESMSGIITEYSTTPICDVNPINLMGYPDTLVKDSAIYEVIFIMSDTDGNTVTETKYLHTINDL